MFITEGLKPVLSKDCQCSSVNGARHSAGCTLPTVTAVMAGEDVDIGDTSLEETSCLSFAPADYYNLVQNRSTMELDSKPCHLK